MTQTRDPSSYVAPAVCESLQKAAFGVFEQVLTRVPLRVAPETISALFTHTARAANSGLSVRWAAKKAQRNFLLGSPEPWSPYQSALLPSETLVPKFKRRVATVMDRISPPEEPTEAALLLPALGATAWASLAFQRAVAIRLHQHFRTRVLMSSPVPRAIVFHDTFWWALLASAQSTPAFSAICAEVAATAIARPGWAGFWEQVFLRDLPRQGGGSDDRIRELPLASGGLDALALNEADDPETTRPSWRSEAPDWAKFYLKECF